MHLRRRLAHLQRIGHPGRLDSSASLVSDATSPGKGPKQGCQYRGPAASVSRDLCKEMIHRRDFVGVTRDLSTYRFGRRHAVTRWLIPRMGDTKGAFPNSSIAKQV